jgi:hypothetical protein
MFLRCTTRKKDGKEHHYWSLVENRRVAGGRVVQRHVLYLGEINDAQERQWRRTVEVFTEGEDAPKSKSLFPEDLAPMDEEKVVRLRLKDLSVRRPRQWGACWLAQSQDRVEKERAIRRRKLRNLWTRLKELRAMKNLSSKELLIKIWQAKQDAGRVFSLVEIQTPEPGQPVNERTFVFQIRKDALRRARQREGRYLLRSNIRDKDPEVLWHWYMQLTQVEEAFKNLKGDLGVRPIFHQLEHRVEAHRFCSEDFSIPIK